MGVRFRVLGPLEATADDTPLPIPSGRLTTLLAGLLLRANRTVPIDLLIRWLWDGDEPDPRRAKATIQEYIRRLRRILGSDGLIRTAPGGYLINADDDTLDLIRFHTLAARGRSAAEAGEPNAAAERLTAALDLWRGPALLNTHSRALHDDELINLAEERLVVSERWAEMMLEIGEHERVIPDLLALTKEHPLRERLWGHLVLALYRDQRHADAIAAYAKVRATLADQLGVDPGPSLRRLHQAVLTNDPILDPKPSPPRPAPTPETPHQLPADINHFTGRTDDLGLLTQQVNMDTDHTTAIAAIEGTAGVGKTALAIHFAHRVAGSLPGGQLYINLRGYGPGDLMTPYAALAVLLSALGTGVERLPADLDARAALWRTYTSSRKILVLLDNARDTRQVRPLLPGSGCLALVTSRAQLRGLVARDGARRMVLDRLDMPDALFLLTSVVGEDRVTAEPDPARSIVIGCARLPLAVRILGERISRHPHTPLAEISEQINNEHDRLAMFDLQDDEDTNLSAVFMHSYQSLDKDAARLFRLLGAQPATDFTPPAAAAVAGISLSQTQILLDRLSAAHLLEQQSVNRYQLHDLMREFAGNLANEQEGDHRITLATRRLLDWYVHTVVNADRKLNTDRIAAEPYPLPFDIRPLTFASFQDASSWLDGELLNLVTVAGHAHDLVLSEPVAWLGRELFSYLILRAHFFDDLTSIYRAALLASRRLNNQVAEAFALNGLGVAHSRLDHHEDAVTYFLGALAIWRSLGEPLRERQILGNLSTTYQRNHQFGEAISHAHESLDIARVCNEPRLEALSLVTLAEAYLKSGDHEQAIAYATSGLELVSETKVSYRQATAFHTLGNAYSRRGDRAKSIEGYRRALSAFHELDMHFEESEALINLGDLYHQSGDPSQARRCWRRALTTLVEMRHPRAEDVLDRLAERHPHPQRG